jgi:hypothetical protein
MNPGIHRKCSREVKRYNILSCRNQQRYFVHSVLMLGAQWCNLGLNAAQIDSYYFGYQIIYSKYVHISIKCHIRTQQKMGQRLVPK